jgi:phosphate acetyltransferase
MNKISFAPETLIAQLRARAADLTQRIVLTDGSDARVLIAARSILEQTTLRPILVGSTSVLLSKARKLGIASSIEIYDPFLDTRQAELASLLRAQLERKDKPLPDQDTLNMMARDQTYCGALLVKAGIADGMVGGAAVPTARVIRAAIQVVGTDNQYPVVSGAFAMLLAEQLSSGQNVLIFSDTAVIPDPSAKQLAAITINTAEMTRAVLGKEPIIALLSFSTYGSSEDVSVTKVREALCIVRKQAPDLCVDGELQIDAALIPEISASKAPGNLVMGRANVLIFPNLDAGNSAYKLVERIGRATALGVILSGLAKPINDLSRGCSIDDIINMVAVTALQSTHSLGIRN